MNSTLGRQCVREGTLFHRNWRPTRISSEVVTNNGPTVRTSHAHRPRFSSTHLLDPFNLRPLQLCDRISTPQDTCGALTDASSAAYEGGRIGIRSSHFLFFGFVFVGGRLRGARASRVRRRCCCWRRRRRGLCARILPAVVFFALSHQPFHLPLINCSAARAWCSARARVLGLLDVCAHPSFQSSSLFP